MVAPDRTHAVYAVVQVATSVQAPPGRVRLPGLDPDATYRVSPLRPGHRVDGPGTELPWWHGDAPRLTGRVLAEVGVQAPALHPERLVLLQARRQDD